jgi:hypothetical protein
MPQDVAVYRHAGRFSLMLWGTFRAAPVMLVRDVFVAAVLAFFACESRELIRDVSHHGRTSAGHVHCYSVSSYHLGQTGRACALVVAFLSCGCTGCALHCCSFGAVSPPGALPGNHNSWPGLQGLLGEVFSYYDPGSMPGCMM